MQTTKSNLNQTIAIRYPTSGQNGLYSNRFQRVCSNQTLNGRYMIIKQIGSSSTAAIHEVEDTLTKSRVAIKTVTLKGMTHDQQERVFNEVKIHSSVHHPNIITFIESFLSKGYLHIVLELGAGGDLFKLIDPDNQPPLAESDRRSIFKQVCEAVSHLHANNIMHRDIKPENVLIDHDGKAKLCDFGWSCPLNLTKYRRDHAGTLQYMSPECLRRQDQSLSTDVWSLGVLLYEMYVGREPFQGHTDAQILERIITTKPVFPVDTPDAVVDLFNNCIRLNPRDRIPINLLLSHRYFSSFKEPPIHSFTAYPFHHNTPLYKVVHSRVEKSSLNRRAPITSKKVIQTLVNPPTQPFPYPHHLLIVHQTMNNHPIPFRFPQTHERNKIPNNIIRQNSNINRF